MRVLRLVLVALGLVLIGLMLLGTLSRYLDLRAFFGTDELGILAAVWFYFIGLAVTSAGRRHIEGGLVSGLTAPRVKRALELLSLAVSLAVLSIFAVAAVLYSVELFETGRRSPYYRLPSLLWVAPLALGLLLSVGFYVRHLIAAWRSGGRTGA